MDHWDAVDDRTYPSFAAVKHVFAQMLSVSHPSEGLRLPQCLVLRRFADCEVRRCVIFDSAAHIVYCCSVYACCNRC